MAHKDESPSLTSLKELIPLQPWRTPPPPFRQNPYDQYVKVKEPRIENGERVYWVAKATVEDDEDVGNIRIPHEGFFDFIDRWVIKKVHQWIDKRLGELLSLPKYDPYHKTSSIKGPE